MSNSTSNSISQSNSTSTSASQYNQWLAGWSDRAPLTIDGTVPGLSGSVTNGIAIVAVPAGIKAECQAAGQDLRFTSSDGTTLLDYAIEDWSVAAPVCHVRVPTVGTGDTVIYCYGGNAGASDDQDKAGVATGLAGYWPLNDASTPADDWASGNDAAQSGGVTFGATGKTGLCCAFDGTDNKLTAGPNAALNLTNFSLAFWYNPTSIATDYKSVFSNNYAQTRSWKLQRRTDDLLFELAYVAAYATTWNGIAAGTWQHVLITVNGTALNIYVDAVNRKSQTMGNSVLADGTTGLVMGNNATQAEWEACSLDNVIFTSTIYGADDAKFLTYNYPGSTMYEWGSQETW